MSCEVCQAIQRIDSGSNDIEVTIKEALHIKYSRPNLNKQLHNSESSFVLNIFLGIVIIELILLSLCT